ncbi:DegT/DnrJ/EryC1/StrS family aminotransferase [Luminiphilus sp.]|nr:DegT/DnrJ/EryC1/StrS family aminotransferase [Luminiphilus sp.]
MIQILEPNLHGNEAKYVNECIEENWISSQGRFVEDFERAMLRTVKERYSLAVSNGTVAIHLALKSLGVGPGDEVIVPNVTFGATVNAILHAGATPVFADVCERSWNLRVGHVESLVTPRTRAIMTVALFGSPFGVDEIADWASSKGLLVIVDAAEAVGAAIRGLDIGSFGDAVTYSYFGNKTLTTGEGGGIIFKDGDVADRARILRDHGMTPGRRYHHEVVGFNYRLTNLQAAIGVAQYERLDCFANRRKEVVAIYKHHLNHLSGCEFQQTHRVIPSNWVVALRFRSANLRGKVENKLYEAGIESRRCFEPMHLQPAFSLYADRNQDFSISEKLFESLLLVPTHVNLSDLDINMICKLIISEVAR